MADNIAEELRVWRRRLRLTQSDVARRLGISSSRYANWEHGTAAPPRAFMLLLQEMGFVPPDEPLTVREHRAPYASTTPGQLAILIETVWDCGRDPDLRASARRELYRVLELPESGSN